MKGIKGFTLILVLLMLVMMLVGCPGRVPATYTLTLDRNNNAWGGVSGGGTYLVDQSVRIEATPYQGYHFLNWTLEGTAISGDAVYEYTMPRENVTLVANFVVGEMVRVEGGTFQMGDEIGDIREESRPVHQVTLTYDFWIGKYAVTFDEYDAYCDAMGISKPYDNDWGRGTRPVINLNWFDAIAYCNWLSEQNGLSPAYDSEGTLLNRDGQITDDITQVEGYRLPTEAEWEYAASGGHQALPIPPRFLYAGSDHIDEVGWYRENSDADGTGRKTQPVGQKRPNELGLYDMSGNVWEWCHDWYELYPTEAKINPIGPSNGRTRVVRGGMWNFGEEHCRVAGRARNDPVNRYLGLRLARTCP